MSFLREAQQLQRSGGARRARHLLLGYADVGGSVHRVEVAHWFLASELWLECPTLAGVTTRTPGSFAGVT